MSIPRLLSAAALLALAACGGDAPGGSTAPTTPAESAAPPTLPAPTAAGAVPDDPSDGAPPPEIEGHASELAEPIEAGRVPLVGETEVEVLRETWDDGSPRLERSVVRDAKGTVNHGPYTRWAEDGSVLERGEYVDGLPHGPYVEYWEPGSKRREGRYEHGLRQGRWSYWTEAGEVDSKRTGVYEADVKVSD